MFSLFERRKTASGAAARAALPDWAAPLFASELAPHTLNADGSVAVWAIKSDTSTATITEQFKANAEEYHQRYANSDHFQALFNQALAATGVKVAGKPLVLDLGSGSGVNSVVPCQRLFAGARTVATDLSGELLQMLARYGGHTGGAHDVVCVVMDAMSSHVRPGGFDLVTGASILHHLERPQEGIAAAARALKPGGVAIFFEPFYGWSLIRACYERILAEAELRDPGLDPFIAEALKAMCADIAARTNPDPASAQFAALDDKWLFSRAHMESMAREAGFKTVQIVPHNDHPRLYRDTAAIQLRLASGRHDLTLPDWAMAVMETFDKALSLQVKRDLLLEGTVVLTKG